VCGIVGYAGRERCVEVLMEGLGHLEYRGYDSAGLALQREGQIERITEVGQLENLTRALAGRNGDLSQVRTGLGHTRWATHGRPSEENAHPHLGGDGSVAVVHNGIIENFSELKEELEGRGVVFRSETDTEVMAHLIAERVEAGETLRIALAGVFQRLEGSFAVAAISVGEPGKVVAARHQSPLVIGLGEGETFLASAVQALLGETHEFLVVENGEIVEIAGSSVEVFTSSGEPVERESFEVDWDAEAVELGGYEDYMLKEIHEQPTALGATLLGRIDSDGVVDLSEVGLDLSEIDRVVVIACGTAYHAGLLGKHAIEKLARIPVEVVIASEYRYADPIADSRTLVVAISQSGETTDTLAAVQAARSVRARVLAVTNTRGSLITREADAVLLTRAGPEICVASTKTFVAQVAALDLLALAVADIRGIIPERELREIGRCLRLAPEKVEETLGLLTDRVEEAVEVFEEARCSLFLGEMKHGPIALVDEHCPVIAVLGEGLIREKILSNVEETIARGASVIAVAREGDKGAGRIARLVLPVPEAPEILAPFICSVPLQLLAYHVAKARGLDVDKPRNLAKSVTVE
jgi:glutamine---fructose-6-phosphate transaminase (isomerizing)